MENTIIIYSFLSWLVFSFLVAIIGKGKEIGYWGLFGCCLLFSPIIGLIIGLLFDKKLTLADCENELLKLHSLLEKGIITYQQFELRKIAIQDNMKSFDSKLTTDSEKSHSKTVMLVNILIAIALIIFLLLAII